MLIPELDMPGHSAAFIRTFHHDMQSPEGNENTETAHRRSLRNIPIRLICISGPTKWSSPTPGLCRRWSHSSGRKAKSNLLEPRMALPTGEIDMTHLWSYRGKTQPGIPAIDSRFHYLNHFDTFADIIRAFYTTVPSTGIPKAAMIWQASSWLSGTTVWYNRKKT